MHAIILAAGVGNRLGPLGAGPKSLLEFGGRSLLERHFAALAALGVGEATLCVGFQAELLEAVARAAPMPVNCVLNPDYRRGSIVSLWTARQALESGEEIVLMDADVLYATSLLKRLVASRFRNCFLLDREFEAGDEPVKLCVRGGRMVEFRKKPDPAISHDFCGESVGFFKFDPVCAGALASLCELYIARGRQDEPYEEAIRDLILEARHPLGFEDITGLPWIEIDFPDDVERARREILPSIDHD